MPYLTPTCQQPRWPVHFCLARLQLAASCDLTWHELKRLTLFLPGSCRGSALCGAKLATTEPQLDVLQFWRLLSRRFGNQFKEYVIAPRRVITYSLNADAESSHHTWLTQGDQPFLPSLFRHRALNGTNLAISELQLDDLQFWRLFSRRFGNQFKECVITPQGVITHSLKPAASSTQTKVVNRQAARR